MILVAIHEKPTEVLPNPVVRGESSIVGSFAHTLEDYDAVLDLMAHGKVDATGWVTEINLNEAEEALHMLRRGAGSKIVVRMDS